jgi:hypothetical protein
MLQAYALQTVLGKMDIENDIINFRSDVQKSLIPPPIQARHPRSSLIKLIKETGKTLALYRKHRRFEQFLNDDLNVTDELSTLEDVARFVSSRHYDAIITGSDQIWNPACWDFSTVYLCDFPFDGKRIAYAPSLGSHPEEIIDNDWQKIEGLANRFEALSTREKRGSEILSRRLNRDVDVMIDPTLLLKAKDYETITSEKLIGEPYILYYTPREESGYFRSALELAQKSGLKIVVTQDFAEYGGHDNVIYHLDCGPKEFLSHIKHANYCIGNSFHLLAFSLIFHKDFFILSKEKDSRILNILEPIGLADRLIYPGTPLTLSKNVGYKFFDEALVTLREKSISFLNQITSI